MRKLREPDRVLGEGQGIPEVTKALEVSEASYHRWRNEYSVINAEDVKRLKEPTARSSPAAPWRSTCSRRSPEELARAAPRGRAVAMLIDRLARSQRRACQIARQHRRPSVVNGCPGAPVTQGSRPTGGSAPPLATLTPAASTRDATVGEVDQTTGVAANQPRLRPRRRHRGLPLSDIWATPGPLRGVAGVVDVVRDRSTPHEVTAARWPLRWKFGNAGASAGRPPAACSSHKCRLSTAGLVPVRSDRRPGPPGQASRRAVRGDLRARGGQARGPVFRWPQ